MLLPHDSLPDQIRIATAAFESNFHRPPSWIVCAPGRVNLIGEHVDYNDGFVLPMAIEKYVVIASAENPNPAGLTNIISLDFPKQHSLDLSQPLLPAKSQWYRYVDGVIEGCKKSNLCVAPFEAVISSTVPLGSGLSSSAALEVADGDAARSNVWNEIGR